MNRFLSAATLVSVAGCVSFGSSPARAADEPKPGKVATKEYSHKGSFELGGSTSIEWDRDRFLVEIEATLGWFVADRFELSLLPSIEYRNSKLADGSRRETSEGEFLVEPSYHLPVIEDALFLFGGVGVGVAYDFSNAAAAVKPRAGLNIEVGSSGVFTPAIDVPMTFGKFQGHSVQDPDSVLVGIEFEAGFTTTF
jgi:hypothetical protein